MLVDFLTKLVQPIVNIRRREWFKAGFMFLYSFSIFASLYVFKPVRSSLYLDAHGAKNLWMAYFFEGLLLIFITALYIRLSRLFPNKSKFFTATTLFLMSNILIFYICFRLHLTSGWLVLLFYGWVATYSVTVATQFWTMANDIFNPEEAKRLFGFIISGGSLGGMCGGALTSLFAKQFGTENLLLLTLVFLGAAIFFSRAVWKREKHNIKATEKKRLKALSKEKPSRVLNLFFKSRYLLLIAGIVMFAKCVSTIVDNQFNGVVEATIQKENLTAFFGAFWGWVAFLSFFMQLYVTSKVLRYLGIGLALLMLPGGLLIGATLTVFFPLMLPIAMGTRLYDGSLNYSINLLGKEILYLPVASDVRYRIKPVIDMLAYRLSKVLAALVILAALHWLGLEVKQLGFVVLAIIPFWLTVAWRVKKEYVEAIRQMLADRQRVSRFTRQTQERVTDVLTNLVEEKSFHQLKELFGDTPSHMRKMSAAACLAFYGGGKDVSRVGKLVKEMVRYEALEYRHKKWQDGTEATSSQKSRWIDEYLVEFLKVRSGDSEKSRTTVQQQEKHFLPKIYESLKNPDESMVTKRKAISFLTFLGTQGAFDLLLKSLQSTLDNSLRFETIKAMNRIYTKAVSCKIHRTAIEKELRREVQNHRFILTMIDFYKQHAHQENLSQDEDFLYTALRAIREESLGRLFRLLGLLYPSEIIHTVYDRLTDEDEDHYGQSIAIELLGNVLKPDDLKAIQTLVDRDVWKKQKKENEIDVIRNLILGPDCWLSVCAIFLVIELKIKDLYPLLDRVAYSTIPIVKEAVAIAKKRLELQQTTT